MSDLSFSIQIIASTLAITAAYALLMSILKKEVNARWVKGEALLALVTAGTSLGLSFGYFLTEGNIILTISGLLLVLGLGNALGLVIINQLKVRKEEIYPSQFVGLAKILSIFMFAAFTAHLLLEFYGMSQL